jgi:hypothetical protein
MKNINGDELCLKLKNEINSLPGSFILLAKLYSLAEGATAEMPAFLQSPEGRAAFNKAVMKLVSEQLISPVGKNFTAQGLSVKYRINKIPAEKNQVLVKQIITTIAPPAALDYYLKHPQDFLSDRDVIGMIAHFLREKNKELLTVNERAYQLFGDEKFFKGEGRERSRGAVVLSRLGLSYAALGCQETAEPFFSFQNKEFLSRVSRNIYIIENKDTFWSFKRNILDDPASRIKADMLIYGEGRKIISSFRFIEEYGVNPEQDCIFYFGDLDAEGINIYCELLDKYPQYKIVPFCEGYQAVLEIGLRKEPVKTPKEQKSKQENIARFNAAFEHTWARKLKSHLEGGFYIPQEALSAAKMKERFGSAAND